MPDPTKYQQVEITQTSSASPANQEIKFTPITLSNTLDEEIYGATYPATGNTLVFLYRKSGAGTTTYKMIAAPSPELDRVYDDTTDLGGIQYAVGGPHRAAGFSQDGGNIFIDMVDATSQALSRVGVLRLS